MANIEVYIAFMAFTNTCFCCTSHGLPGKQSSELRTTLVDNKFINTSLPCDMQWITLLLKKQSGSGLHRLSLIHISEPTRLGMISYAVFCLKKKKKKKNIKINNKRIIQQ
eukprot:TRINITY_DN29149_c0_g1_i1.p5 TRINITY_DN29149_c0_g1~~TRINITY_DN29149_c0_g1_i1.p5  ORF type:complete len:110 (-),score=5.03 TRINITY_DN29149_c0_g1_i1:18-347(-)